MGRGRPQKAAKKQQEDDIRREILASSERAGTATKQATGENPAQLSLDLQKLKGTNTLNETGTSSKEHKQLEKLLEKPWKNLFSTNRLATKDMNLSFIPPTVIDGEKVVEVTTDDVAYENEKWKSVIVVYVVGISPSIGAMERFILVQGSFTTNPTVLYHSDGYFVVRFVNEEERDVVLCSGPQYLLKRPVIIKPWTTYFNFSKKILTTIPLWNKLPSLPLNCWNVVVLSKIGSSLGKTLYVDECTTQPSRISFAQILVEVDITRPLLKKIKIQDSKGRLMEQEVWYDWKPQYREKCLQSGIVVKPTHHM
ncbi:hypothetical protein P3L10_003795 [Capsicum annuum]